MIRKKSAYEKIIRSLDKRNNYVLKLAKKLNITHSHVQNCIKKLTEEGIVIRLPRETEIIPLILSEKGERIKQLYIDLEEAYSSENKEVYEDEIQ